MAFGQRKLHQIRSPKYVKRIKRLLREWARISRMLDKRSRKTQKGLLSGKLQQIDNIIYSVYMDAASADALARCISDLEAILDAEDANS